jgi:type II secretory pathway pseudopilin PulG
MIELVVAIAIIGILSVISSPKAFNLLSNAEKTAITLEVETIEFGLNQRLLESKTEPSLSDMESLDLYDGFEEQEIMIATDYSGICLYATKDGKTYKIPTYKDAEGTPTSSASDRIIETGDVTEDTTNCSAPT